MTKNKKDKNKKTELRKLTFQLYLNPYVRKNYIRIYEVLLEMHNRTYEMIYKDIKESPKLVSDKYYEEANAFISWDCYSEDADPSDYYELIEEYVADRMQEQSLMHYQFELMSLSNLYQVFEQQLRKWLFEEMSHNQNEYINQIKFVLDDEEKDYGDFYNKFRRLEKVLEEMKLTFTMSSSENNNPSVWDNLFDDEENDIEVPIVETEIWKTIRECNLISNTFKHGSGYSAMELYKLHPEYFETVLSSDTKLMNLYRTTNMKEVLSVEKISFEKYISAMKDFWEKLKQHQNGSLMLKIDVSQDDVKK